MQVTKVCSLLPKSYKGERCFTQNYEVEGKGKANNLLLVQFIIIIIIVIIITITKKYREEEIAMQVNDISAVS
jgi:hypothetical protein